MEILSILVVEIEVLNKFHLNYARKVKFSFKLQKITYETFSRGRVGGFAHAIAVGQGCIPLELRMGLRFRGYGAKPSDFRRAAEFSFGFYGSFEIFRQNSNLKRIGLGIFLAMRFLLLFNSHLFSNMIKFSKRD